MSEVGGEVTEKEALCPRCDEWHDYKFLLGIWHLICPRQPEYEPALISGKIPTREKAK